MGNFHRHITAAADIQSCIAKITNAVYIIVDHIVWRVFTGEKLQSLPALNFAAAWRGAQRINFKFEFKRFKI